MEINCSENNKIIHLEDFTYFDLSRKPVTPLGKEPLLQGYELPKKRCKQCVNLFVWPDWAAPDVVARQGHLRRGGHFGTVSIPLPDCILGRSSFSRALLAPTQKEQTVHLRLLNWGGEKGKKRLYSINVRYCMII